MPTLTRSLAVLLLAPVFPLLARPVGAQQRIDERRRFAADGAIRIYNLYGSVRVIGWDTDSVTISGTTSPGERFFLASTERGMKLGVESDDERTVRGTDLVIHVPARARVWVKSASAEIDVRGVRGGLDLYTVGAGIRVAGMPRELNAEAMDGSIVIDGSPGWLRAKTASGAITLQGTSEDVALSSVSGALAITSGAISRGRFETVTGDIHFDGAFDPRGTVTFESHSGRIELMLSNDVAAEFDITNILGTIENAISRAAPRTGTDGRGRSLSFATRPGGAVVTIRSFKGPIVLRKK